MFAVSAGLGVTAALGGVKLGVINCIWLIVATRDEADGGLEGLGFVLSLR
jgi:hypothetical protein